MAIKQSKSGGAKKYGRMKEWCKRYRLLETRAINKAKKARKHQNRVAKKAAKLAKRAQQ